MIDDKAQFESVIQEIADWTLERRRCYIAEIEKAFGQESAQQIKDGLIAYWDKRQK
jgi:hypothetical protein